MTLIAAVLLAPAAHAGCEEPTTDRDLLALLEEALEAYSALELDTFDQRVADLHSAVPCLSDAIAELTAARLHGVGALQAFGQRDIALAEASFAAARAASPGFRMPASVVAEGSPLSVHMDAIDLREVRPEPVMPPASGSIWLDGRSGRERRPGFPVVFQHIEGDTVHQSALLPPGAPLPSYPEPGAGGGGGLHKALLVTAIASSVVTVGAFGANRAVAPCKVLVGPCDIPDDGTRHTVNLLMGVSTASLMLAGGSWTGWALTGKR
ncbi:MAG: hypothetical protein KC656_35250 [Myxococcales bacterium]|nr:hypothetical protein [Myxococcales bacterium]